MILTQLKKQGKCPTKTYLIMTDYICHPGTEFTDVDVYFIPHMNLLDEFCRNGIPTSKIIPIDTISIMKKHYHSELSLNELSKIYIDAYMK